MKVHPGLVVLFILLVLVFKFAAVSTGATAFQVLLMAIVFWLRYLGFILNTGPYSVVVPVTKSGECSE